MPMHCEVHKVPMNAPDDMSALKRLIDSGVINPSEIVAILGKTEGNGGVNDFTRAYATQSLLCYLSQTLNVSVDSLHGRISFVMSGGTEGILSPHMTVFTVRRVAGNGHFTGGLAISVSRTDNYLPEDIGTMRQVEKVAKGVTQAISATGIINLADVHFVQIKCPLLTTEKIAEARSRSKTVVTEDTYKSMAYSRAASSLGVAIAMKELKMDQIEERDILHNSKLYSSVASASSGLEINHDEIVVMGNSPLSSSPYRIGHSLMENALDKDAVSRALWSAGVKNPKAVSLVNVFAKAEADPSGFILGQRHTMLTDTDVSPTRMARATVGAVLASEVRDPMLYVSGGAEHQGVPGGGPLAVVFIQE